MTGRVRYAHFLLWHGDAAYRRAWFIAPQLLAVAGLVWLFAERADTSAANWGTPQRPWNAPAAPAAPPAAPPQPAGAASLAEAEELLGRAVNFPGAKAELVSRADAGDANMQFELGVLSDPDLKIGKAADLDAAKALRYYQLAADQGLNLAQFNYGLYLAYGKYGVQRDPQAGFSWLAKAASSNMMLAQRELARLYKDGLGVVANAEKALEYYGKAAAQGDLPSKFQIAEIYWSGQPPIAPNRMEAVKYYREVASNPEFPAAARMIGWAYMLGVGGAPTDRPTALQWFRDAADRGDANAKSVIGDAYYDGWPPYPRDRVEAIKWYKAAAVDPDQVSAIRRVGIALRYGDGVLPDPAESVVWLRRAADRNDVYAEAELGAGYFYGNLGYKQDYNEAFKWLSKAAVSKEVPVAQRLLGICYLEGYGAAPDPRQGFYWLQQAANNGDREATRILRRNR